MYEPSGVEHAPLLQHVASASLTVVAGGLWPGRRKPIGAQTGNDVNVMWVSGRCRFRIHSVTVAYVYQLVLIPCCSICGNQAELSA